jgi:hypothetical protein
MSKYTKVLRNNPRLEILKEINAFILSASVKERQDIVEKEKWMEIVLELMDKNTNGNFTC